MATMTTAPRAVPPTVDTGDPPALTIAGWLLTGLGGTFLMFDGLSRLVSAPYVAEAAAIGRRPEAFVPIAIIELAFLALYLVPRTSVLGAILLTAFLGGAVAAQVRVDAPLFGYVMAGGWVGPVLWAALCLRSPRLRSLVPFGR